MKKATAIKKFQFFEIDEDEGVNWEEQTAQFANIYPYSMFAFDNIVFFSGEKKLFTNQGPEKKYMIFRAYKGCILNEYNIYSKRFIDFVAKMVNNELYFFTNGLDMEEKKEVDKKGNPKVNYYLKNSIKIYRVTDLLSKTGEYAENPINYYLTNEICLSVDLKSQRIVFSPDLKMDNLPQTTSFALTVSNDLKMLAIGHDKTEITLLTSENIAERTKKYNVYRPDYDQLEDEIKNLFFDTINTPQGRLNVLYGTNSNILFAFTFSRTESSFGVLNQDFGGLSKAISSSEGRLIMGTSTGDYIMEYINLEKGPSWFIEGNKKVVF